MARRGQKAAALHDLADLIRFRHGIDLPSTEEARALIENIRAVWNERDLLLGPNTRALDAQSEQVIRTDLLDLAIASAELRLGLASAGRGRRGPTRCLAASRPCEHLVRAQPQARPPAPIDGRRAGARPARPATTIPSRSPPWTTTTRDASTSGPADSGRPPSISSASSTSGPRTSGPTSTRGSAPTAWGSFTTPLAAFRTCIALAPNSAECYYNRARVAEALGRGDQAMRDYSRALELDPALTSASINRGILAYKNGKNDAAIADFRQAIRSASDSRTLGLIHYNLALAHLAARRPRGGTGQRSRGHGPRPRRRPAALSDRLHARTLIVPHSSRGQPIRRHFRSRAISPRPRAHSSSDFPMNFKARTSNSSLGTIRHLESWRQCNANSNEQASRDDLRRRRCPRRRTPGDHGKWFFPAIASKSA